MNFTNTKIIHSALCLVVLLLSACGGGGGSSASGTAPGKDSVTTAIRSSAPVTSCPNGGISVDAGIDTNGNGILDTSEVTSTQYVCNGASGLSVLVAVTAEPAGTNCANGGNKVSAGPDTNGNGILDSSEIASSDYVCNGTNGTNGTNGANGTNGTNGTNGLNTLVATVAEPAGANCASGGSRVTSGLDNNANSILDAGEITSTTYVCNGINGANGTSGTNGTNGSNGTNGLNTLMAIVAEPAGANCANGGSKATSGMDANANGILDAGEITSTTYVCNGATGATGATGPAGPGVTWVTVTGKTQQAVSNTGYMAAAGGQVTIILPAAPAVGDVVQVTGVGAGGWKIAQNGGQFIVTKNVLGNIGAVWTSRETARNWQAVASSSDGVKLVAVVVGGQIYTSTDAGVTWTARDSARNWQSVASSADGTKLVAVVGGGLVGGLIYTSTDSGATWTPAWTPTRFWQSVASSSDGTKLIAVEYGGNIYISTDSGVTWWARETARFWQSVASSSDGTKLAAVVNGGQIYTSTDSGATWTARETARNWASVASSADGTKLVAVVFGGQIYTSTDSGVTWTPRETARNWFSVASSADGNKLAAVAPGGQIYISVDSGMTWTARDMARNWMSVAFSADGTKLAAADFSGILTSVPTATQSSTVGPAGLIGGVQYDAVELQYIGNNIFTVLSYAGYLTVL